VGKETILVVEDAPDISSLLKIYFVSQGYEVLTAMRGQIALDICRKTPPNLALLDVNLPDMEGYDIGKALRQSPRTRHIPIIFLTARGEKRDRLYGLGEVQADYYLTKPFDIEEVHMIVKGALERSSQKNLTHPVTKLPTAEILNDQYRTLLNSTGWAMAVVHINGFDTFTQVYGTVVGEDVLKFTALLLSEVINEAGRPEDFVGQMVVGSSFVITSDPDHMPTIVAKLCERFDAEIGLHYNFKDRKNGYITTNDDQGQQRQVPLMSISIGVLTSADGPFYDIRELSETAEEVRQRALTESREQGRKSHASTGVKT
jgi:DNA-binding response OmpR family regulator